jgi:TolB-like protein/DNA-binding winged helix-turn-helix (wHTH) protein/Tfp pilus assembly protein PilF
MRYASCQKITSEQLVELKQGFRLGSWSVEPLTGEIRGDGGVTHLEPKVMEVLVALAQRAQEVVEREDLLRQVWGNRAAVADEPLTRCIAELRRALGDSRQTPKYLQTIPKRGYRLLCPVAPLVTPVEKPAPAAVERAPPAAAPAPPAPPQPEIAAPARAPVGRARRAAHPALVGTGLAALLAITGVALWAVTRGTAETESSSAVARNTIAVLPFTEIGAAPDDAYLGEGLAEEILNRLSGVGGLRVVARTSSFALGASTDDVRGIAQQLGVAYVLEGTVRRDGQRVRIGAQLVDADRGFRVWSDSYDGVLGDIFALQDEIANTIVARLRDTVPTELARAPISTSAPTASLAAYELLLRGRHYLHRRDEESLRRSIRLFEQATQLDPSYGQAYVEQAKAYALLPSYSTETQDEMFDLALATLAAGVEQDPSLDASMQVVLALVAFARWDWIAAEVAFRRALEQANNDSDLLVWYSQFLSAVGRASASADYARRAKEMDPLSPVANHRLAVASMWIDADEEAARYETIAEELGMGPAPDAYTVLKIRQGDHAAVRPLLIGVQTMFAKPTAWVDPLLDALADAARRPQAVEALARAAQARDIPPKYLFGAWLYVGEPERALEAALRLVNDRPSFNVEFVFSREARELRRHPRFGELVRAIGLHRYWDQFGWPEMCRESADEIVCT